MVAQEVKTAHTPESLVGCLSGESGVVLLHSAQLNAERGRYSFVGARPFLRFRSWGAQCETCSGERRTMQFGNPWRVLELLLARFEMEDELDRPWPAGGCFGYWGYDLKKPLEKRTYQRSWSDAELPDCHLGFYGSLVVFDHFLGQTWIVATGLTPDGKRNQETAREQRVFWLSKLGRLDPSATQTTSELRNGCKRIWSSFSPEDFVAAVRAVQDYIRAGDIYQANLSQRFVISSSLSGWEVYQRLAAASPAPYAAYLDCGQFQLASSSPELFLSMAGRRIETRPIKGTRARAADSEGDRRLAEELQHSPKENAELLMITDLLRNDLGKVCAFGSVHVLEFARLEPYAHVQHLVSSIAGELNDGVSHLAALERCFPGGSVTGAPKIRAMEIIDELEPVGRGPYTGALGFLGFNGQSQLSMTIRTAICAPQAVCFHAGAGIVADSIPEAEYEETLIKARGFFEALGAGTLTREIEFGDELGLCGGQSQMEPVTL